MNILSETPCSLEAAAIVKELQGGYIGRKDRKVGKGICKEGTFKRKGRYGKELNSEQSILMQNPPFSFCCV